jgi:hypothetical protein
MTTAFTAAEQAEIHQLFARYAWTLDTGDVDGVLATFTEEAVIEDPYGRFEGPGPGGLRLFFDRIVARPDFAGRQHWVDQVVLTREGADAAGAQSYVMVPAMYPTGAVNTHLVAFYRDRLVRRGGRWLFLERVVGPRG